jgi:hypothetical protein
MEVAQFVIDNLDAQIVSYAKVLETMRDHLEDLSAAERARVEEAAATLRKVRAGAPLPLTVLDRTQLEGQEIETST